MAIMPAVVGKPPAAEVTPAQWLDAQPKPAFKAGHTLPRLTRYGWECMPLVTGKPLAKDWGYALEFTRYVTDLEAVARIDVPNSREYQTVELALAEPDVYKLNVGTTQAIPSENVAPSAYTKDAAGNILSGQGVSADGTTWGGAGPLISLEAPDSLWEAAAELRAAPLRALVARGIPIDSIHNGGESGLGIPGFAQDAWNKDPAIGAAIGASLRVNHRKNYQSSRAEARLFQLLHGRWRHASEYGLGGGCLGATLATHPRHQ